MLRHGRRSSSRRSLPVLAAMVAAAAVAAAGAAEQAQGVRINSTQPLNYFSFDKFNANLF